jgi:hypothetical protein
MSYKMSQVLGEFQRNFFKKSNLAIMFQEKHKLSVSNCEVNGFDERVLSY